MGKTVLPADFSFLRQLFRTNIKGCPVEFREFTGENELLRISMDKLYFRDNNPSINTGLVNL